jgi:hypothetical protein
MVARPMKLPMAPPSLCSGFDEHALHGLVPSVKTSTTTVHTCRATLTVRHPRAWFELREWTTCNSNVQQTNKSSTMREAVY